MGKKHFRKNKIHYSKDEIRTSSQKAFSAIKQIDEKYSKGISDITSITEEARAWFLLRIQRFRECCTKIVFSQKPNWWEAMRLVRNKIAHQTEDLSDAEFSSVVSTLFANLAKIKSDLKENIKRLSSGSKKKRKFEKFASPEFGNEFEKKQLVDAVADFFNPSEPEDLKIDFPENKFSKITEEILSEIASHNNNKDFISNHYGLSENIQTDILEWLLKTYSTLEKENPFKDEAIFIEEKKRLSTEEIADDLAGEKSKTEYHYKRLPSISESKRGDIEKSSVDFKFYKNEFSKEKETILAENIKSRKAKKESDKDVEQETLQDDKEEFSWKSSERAESLRRNFIKDLEKNLIDRKNKWELKRIDELRKEFLEKLYSKIDNFIKLEKLILPFIKDLGRLWDLSEGVFETSGFEILETFADLLEKDESLQELAKLLGKQNRAQATFEKELRDKVVIKSEWKPQAAYRGSLNGIRYSNDIPSVLPSELALMKNPAAKKLFQLKFAQKQLLSFDYQNKVKNLKQEIEQEEISVEKKEPKGPVIICVDTSGSMHGTPESIAKTITFALTKIAVEEKRKCYLISFSTGIETLDLSDFSNKPVEKLVKFLKMSFNGGTDASPALKHSLKMLSQNDWKNADVLMVSDFVMGNLPNDLVAKIEAEKKKDTLFYSLVIGSSGNRNMIACFNHNWYYNMNDPHASRHLVEQLHLFGKDKSKQSA